MQIYNSIGLLAEKH